MVLRRTLEYPIFLECSQLSKHAFWKNVFEDLAYGVTPFGSYINKGHLCCNFKNKEFVYKIDDENKPIKEHYEAIKDLLHVNLGFLSSEEKESRKNLFYILEEKIKNSKQTWRSIKKESIKNVFIQQFVIEMSNKYNLSSKQTRQLLGEIKISLIIGDIDNNDIIYSNGKITEINKITFSKGNYNIKKSKYCWKEKKNSDDKIDDNFLYNGWTKYLELLRKKKRVRPVPDTSQQDK